MRKLHIVLAVILIYASTLEAKAAFNNNVATTINLTDYVSNAVITLPLSTFEESHFHAAAAKSSLLLSKVSSIS